MNLGIFSGNLARDAELRTLPDGQPVTNFNLAVETGTRDKPKTMWLDCTFWGKRAEGVNPYLTKGSKITVSGRVSLDEYTKNTGGTGYRLRVNVAEIDLHGPKSSGAAQAGEAHAGSKRDLDDDMPF